MKKFIHYILILFLCNVTALYSQTIEVKGNQNTITKNNTSFGFTDSTNFGIVYQGKTSIHKFIINNIGYI